MIDGVTSRPFSAKTLPPMVKSGNKEIEKEVIESSRKLYCKPREQIENEINNWSGMSLGNNNNGSSNGHISGNITSGGLEKFPIICSLCGLEKSVPFKPELGRLAYCKECIAKIKSGEVKVEKGNGENPIRYDDSKFFKPLSDLGIEFPSKEEDKEVLKKVEEKIPVKEVEVVKEKIKVPEKKNDGIISTFKNVFKNNNEKNKNQNSQNKPVVENLALKEVLNKTLKEENKETKIEEIKIQEPVIISIPKAPEPASLDILKNLSHSKSVRAGGDRSASREDMDKLKDLIQVKIEKKTEDTTSPLPMQTGTPPLKEREQVIEVPEDVLRKILEE